MGAAVALVMVIGPFIDPVNTRTASTATHPNIQDAIRAGGAGGGAAAGATAGKIIGGILGTAAAPGIGTAVGAVLGGMAVYAATSLVINLFNSDEPGHTHPHQSPPSDSSPSSR